MTLRVAIGPSSFAELDDSPLRRLRESGCEVVPNPHGRRLSEGEIIRHLEGIDGLIAGLEPLNARVLDSAPRLKAIARVGIGVTNVDFDAAAAHGIAVSSTPEGPANAVAELTIAALLTLCRGILPASAALHAGRWEKTIGTGLGGLRVLIVGYGRIGRRFHELLKPFGCDVLMFDPFAEPHTLPDEVETAGSLSEALAVADIVSLHASGVETILGPREFASMKPGGVLLNSARGELVDEDALCDALDSGALIGAWCDAFVEEPYTGRLTGYAQVLLTPHVGTYTRQCRLDMETAAVGNLLRDLGVSG